MTKLRIVAGTDSALSDAIAAGDPIYAAIERHKAAAVAWNAALDVQRDDDLDYAVAATRERLVNAGAALVATVPTTLAGIVAAISYMRKQMRNDAYMPWEIEFEFEYDEGCPGDCEQTMGWLDAFLNTITEAVKALDHAGGV